MSNLEASRILASALKDVDEILKVNNYETDEGYDAEINNDRRNILPEISFQDAEGKHCIENLNDCRNLPDETYLYRAGKDFSVLINRLQICINKLNQSTPAASICTSEYQALDFRVTENSSFDIAHPTTTQRTKFNLNLIEQPQQMISQYMFPPNEFSTYLNDKRFHQRITKLRGQVQAQANRIAELEKDGNPLSYMVNKNCTTTGHRNKNISQLISTDMDNLQLLNEVSKQHLRINALEETNRDLEEKINKLEKELSQRPNLFNLRNSYEDLQSLKYNRQCATICPTTVSNRSATLSNNISTLNESSRESNRLNYPSIFRRSITPVTFDNRCSFITTPNQPEYNLNFINQSLTGTQSTPPTSRLINDKPYRYDAYIPCEEINKLSFLGENYAHLNSDQFKSASLNELCYSRVMQPVTTTTNINTTTSSNNIVSPNTSKRWLAQNRYSMKSPPADIFNSSIQESGRINLLPPQYGSSYHQHIYNNSRTRSPIPLQWYPYTRNNFIDGGQTSADCQLNGSVNLFNSSGEGDSPSSGRCTTVQDTHLYTSRNKSNLSNASSSSPSDQQHHMKTVNSSTNILKDEKSLSLSKSTLNGKNQLKRLNIERANFITWDKNMISAWLYKIGLGYTVTHTRRWLTSGQDLVNESKKSLAQLMCIRNPLHLKKLLIHIRLCMKDQCPNNNSNNINNNYNYGCLYRNIEPPENFDMPGWLHDLGLSSYIPQFDNCIIDPYVLDQLTMDDLSVLKMSNELHVLSLRWGLQMLRHINFDRNRLCRSQMEQCEANLPCKRNMLHSPTQLLNHIQDNIKPTNVHNGNRVHTSCLDTISTLQSNSGNSDINFICSTYLPIQICYWTQQRVMNWLQSIELPEYASELCGSGVHGALMILEDRFTPDLLADILRIPQVKSLVRRHLTNKFIELVGLDIWKRKQPNETTNHNNNNNNNPLTIHSKIKFTKKKNIFNSNRGHKSNHYNHVSSVGDDDASTELVCPIEIDASHMSIFAEEVVKPNRQSMHLRAENVPTILIDPVATNVQHLELQETDL